MHYSPSAIRSAAPHWRLFILYGLISIICGFTALMMPGFTVMTAGLLFGWACAISGVLAIVDVVRSPKGERHWMDVATGIVSLLVGIGLLIVPGAIVPAFAWAVALWLACSGFFALAALRRSGRHGAYLAVLGICDLLCAVLVLIGGFGSAALLLSMVVGIALLLSGGIKISMGLRLRHAAHLPGTRIRAA